MSDTETTTAAPSASPIAGILDKLNCIPRQALIDLAARAWVAAIFWKSGRTKVTGDFFDFGNWELGSSVQYLFEQEYALPVLHWETAAWLAVIGEHLLPLMLFLGLGARFGALGLLGMTAVIQFLVYPNLWPDHLLWATVLVYILAGGAGKFSLDHLIAKKLNS